jgi:hypothetical protein
VPRGRKCPNSSQSQQNPFLDCITASPGENTKPADFYHCAIFDIRPAEMRPWEKKTDYHCRCQAHSQMLGTYGRTNHGGLGIVLAIHLYVIDTRGIEEQPCPSFIDVEEKHERFRLHRNGFIGELQHSVKRSKWFQSGQVVRVLNGALLQCKLAMSFLTAAHPCESKTPATTTERHIFPQ